MTITVSQSSMQFFLILLFTNDRILRNYGLFSSLNNLKDSTFSNFLIYLSFSNHSYLFIKLIQFFNISDLQLENERLMKKSIRW